MAEYIDRNAVINAISREMDMQDLYLPVHFLDVLNDVPAAAVKPVTRAKWKRELWFITCPNCGCTMADKDDEGEWLPTNFCPNCGADMRENE